MRRDISPQPERSAEEERRIKDGWGRLSVEQGAPLRSADYWGGAGYGMVWFGLIWYDMERSQYE